MVHAEMPGVSKDKIDVALTTDGIEISAETDVETEDTEKNFVVRERVTRIFTNNCRSRRSNP